MTSHTKCFKVPQHIIDMLEELKKFYNCSTSELLRLLVSDRYREIKIREEKTDE